VTDDLLIAAFKRGQEQWPAVKSLTLEVFRAFVEGAAVDPAAVGDLAGDVYLAAAAAAGNDDAVRVFDSQLLSELPRWLALKAKYDPRNVFTSDLGRRVGLVPGATAATT